MSRRHPHDSPSDIAQIRGARALWAAQEGTAPKKHRRRQHRARGKDAEAQRLDAIARWLVSDDK